MQRNLMALAVTVTWLAGASWLLRSPAKLVHIPGTCPPAGGAAGGATAPVRVLTWNVHASPLEILKGVLGPSGANVLALQEVFASRSEMARLSKSLHKEAFFLPLAGSFGLAVLTDLPVLAVRYQLLPSGREPRAYMVVETPGVAIVNTHLEPSPRRKAQLALLRQGLEELPGPVVLLGDLNEEGLDAFFGGFQDLGRDSGITYPNLAARIDYVLARGVRGSPAEVVPSTLSDHYALYVTLELASPACSPPPGG